MILGATPNNAGHDIRGSRMEYIAPHVNTLGSYSLSYLMINYIY